MKTTSNFRKPWLSCVGSDRVSTMLRQEYWERFRQVRKSLPFEFIRCHGLLGDDLGVVRVDEIDGVRRTFYNFSYLDQIFDTMLEHQVRPFLELGFMPEALASGNDTVFWWKGNITPPRQMSQWQDLLRALLAHWFERYGADEVRRWPIEVWNEPNLTQFWKDADQKAYFDLYEASVLAIKAFDPQLKVGGPAICGGSDHWIDDFLGFVKQKKLPLDFFTRHLYSGLTPTYRNPEVMYQYLAPPEKPVEELRQVRARIDAAGFGHLELHITEFNTSYHPMCPVHDTAFNAAHLARLLSEAGGVTETMSFWTFCDLFEETDVPRAFFHGGFGLLGREGVPKPTFHLFAFFAALGQRILERTANRLVTERSDSIALVAWNPVSTQAVGKTRQTINVPWSRGPVLVRRRRVHETAANPRALWVTLGRPRFPDRATVEVLKQAAVPAVEAFVLTSEAGRFRLELNLEPNEVTLVELYPFEDQTPDYPGNDDSKIDGYRPVDHPQGGLS